MKKIFLVGLLFISYTAIYGQTSAEKPTQETKGQTKSDTARIQRPLQEAFASPTLRYAPPGTIIERTRIDTNVTESQLIRYQPPTAKKED